MERPSLGFTVSAAHSAHGTPLLVLYGSNGGSTHAFAQQFCMRAQALGFKPCLSPMNDMCELSAVAKASKCVVLLSATYNGLPPDQAGTFMAALKVAESSHAQPFRDVAYAVFGAGNTDWDSTYQVVPRLIDLQFATLGARRLLARGVGNSAGDIDLDFTLWSNALWPMLAEFASIELVVSEASTFPNLVVEQTSASPVRLEMAYEADMRLVEMTANRELQPRSTEQSTRHVEFALNGQQYLAGDHLVVMAENEPSIVEQLMDRLGCTMDCVICKPQHDGAAAGYPVLTGSNLDGHRPVLLRDLLTKAFDLSRPLSAQCFEYVQTKVTDPFEREQLQALSHAAMQRMQMPLVELLLKFRSIRLSVGEALALLPPLKPRLYSISSSPLHQASTLSITVGVVSGKTPTGRIHNGVCSTFLSRKPVGEKVWVMIRDTKSSFRPPAPELPMIMIGPGTGVAPMMGFLQERRSQRMAGQKVGEIVLFFGCRSENSFIYEEELNSYVADGTLAHLHVAFSRTGHKEYVQHLMVQHASRLWQMLQASTALRVNLLSLMHGTDALGI